MASRPSVVACEDEMSGKNILYNWVASHEVPNGLSRCHTKRTMGARGCAHPSFGRTPTFYNYLEKIFWQFFNFLSFFLFFLLFFFEKSVSYLKKDGHGHACPSLARVSIPVSFDFFLDCCRTTELDFIPSDQDMTTKKLHFRRLGYYLLTSLVLSPADTLLDLYGAGTPKTGYWILLKNRGYYYFEIWILDTRH